MLRGRVEWIVDRREDGMGAVVRSNEGCLIARATAVERGSRHTRRRMQAACRPRIECSSSSFGQRSCPLYEGSCGSSWSDAPDQRRLPQRAFGDRIDVLYRDVASRPAGRGQGALHRLNEGSVVALGRSFAQDPDVPFGMDDLPRARRNPLTRWRWRRSFDMSFTPVRRGPASPGALPRGSTRSFARRRTRTESRAA